MPSPFGSILSARLEVQALSVRRFAVLVGCSHTLVNATIAGTRTPPLDALPAWADALALTGKDRERFILAGQLAHAPEEVRAYVAKLEGERKRKK